MSKTVMTKAMKAKFHDVVTEGGDRPMSRKSSDAMATELAAVIDGVLAEERQRQLSNPAGPTSPVSLDTDT